MKITDILQAYHTMPACDRLDLICRMLRHCIPYEMRFLGTILLDGARSHFKSHIGKIETSANRVNYYSTMKDVGLTHEVCEKLCCALAVLHADNRPVAEIIFKMLNDRRAISFFQESNDLRVMQDFRLLYVMAVNHPALSFNQRQHLMYTYLQPMDRAFVEKLKYSFSGSFSNSMEQTLSCELDGGLYRPDGHFGEISPDAYIVRCEVHSVYKRTTDKRYAYMIQVDWSDGVSSTVRRTYGDFFSFQTKLLDLFPEEGGQKGKKHPRLIPFLPGKTYSKFLKNKEVAEKRLPELHRYSRELTSLPEHVTRSPHVLDFFKPKSTDKKEDYPAFHKITTLYDLIESGKVKARVFSDPNGISPAHSPIPKRSSPLNRAMQQNSGATPSDSSPRSAHTLPPTASTQQVGEELTPVIPRRPTYPLSRQLQKSEPSAFTPVGQSTLTEEDHASSITLTASVISIPGSGTTTISRTTPPSPQTTPTLTSSTPTSSISFVYSSSSEVRPSSIPSSTSNRVHAGSIPASISHALSSGSVFSSVNHAYQLTAQSNGMHHHGDDGVLREGEEPLISNGGIVMVPANSTNEMWSHPIVGVASPPNTIMCVCGVGGITSSPHQSFSPTQHITSPTSALSSPILSSNLSPSLVPSPSPPHSGSSTPRGGVASYPPQQQQILYPPYSPIYFYGNSPLPSPLPSPKTSNKWHGSYTSVQHGPTEHETILKWLKSLRLHKYHPIFENVTYEELCVMTMEDLESKSMTTGAAKKLLKKLDELKKSNFIGFRDMPFNSSMARKPSTCSLPAALLMEQGLTSSGYDRFSPTGSTCSLDKAGGWGNYTRHNKQSFSHEMAAKKRGGSKATGESGVNGSSGVVGGARSEGTSKSGVSVPGSGVPGGGGGGGGSGGTDKSSIATPGSGVPGSGETSDGNRSSIATPGSGVPGGSGGTSDINSSSIATPGSGVPDGSGGTSDINSSSIATPGSGVPDGGGGTSDINSSSIATPGSGVSGGGGGTSDGIRSSIGAPGSGVPGGDGTSNGDGSPGSGVPGGGTSGVGVLDTAIVKVIPDKSAPPSSTTTTATTATTTVSDMQPPKPHLSSESVQTGVSTPIWADVEGEEPLGPVNKPDWAAMPGTNGESCSAISTIPAAVTSDPSVSSSYRIHSPSRPSLSAPHTPISGYHHAHHHAHHARPAHYHQVGGSHEAINEIIIPQPLHPPAGRNQVGGVNSNWTTPIKPYLLPSGGVHGQGQRSLHSNGIMRTPQNRIHNIYIHPSSLGGVASYPISHANHNQAPPPLICYNCGKRGHLGNTCPGVTMDTDNASTFHKQLERLVNASQPAKRTH